MSSTLRAPVEAAPPARPAAPAQARRRPSHQRRQSLAGVLFVLPFLVVVVVFLALPLGFALWLSLHTSSLALGDHFSGLDNYRQAFTDPVFLAGVRRVVLFGVVQIPVMLGIALAGALALDAISTRMATVYRFIAFMPYAVPAVIGALMWGFLYSKTFGPFAGVGKLLGGGPLDFFGGSLLLASLGNIVTWAWTGYNMIVLYAALQGVPREMYEAAVLDGASHVQIALRVKVPAIRQALSLAVIFTVIGTMQFFTEPSIMARFAPDIDAGYTPNLYAYAQAFRFSAFNYSAAISFTLGLVVFVISYAFVFVNRRRAARTP
ncbi:carbohydrate ABC transporter membrane protein 1 (CUT1 family) [Motilibacter rhizosphaerae]|uniref:Carbohydrate ABC transporter membrane protein 1 (CUT1 family) n=1 Tax=Motilibacter rhizosphaerae TaxID=598652 RepID=A0A4Q7NVY8_9ACTN|nr:sugar ABC transporter permease [Motilibacter rhizosphaerae]RZS91431.1 carbohydrate ABC transporter membrane protein 1 (CUT1 family) [Motilibacter rhizosphaerae]